ncbi:MAG TPA: DUF4381 family protein [Dyella sp.]|uniref:DUF4381 family protein n=1 Tax=Dyella sp. TaxID=1869338 RepID=UPI002F93F9DB
MRMQQAPAGPTLRDIHVPPAPSWWPPAPGWWLLAILAVALAVLAARWWRRQYHRRLRHRRLLAEIDAIAARHAGEPGAFAAGMHRLLRRIVRLYDAQAMQASGDAWRAALARVEVDAATLDRLMDLDTAMYRPAADLDQVAVSAAMRRWLTRALRQRPIARAAEVAHA